MGEKATMVKNEPDVLHFRKIPQTWEFTAQGNPVLKGLKVKMPITLNLTPFHEFKDVAPTKRKSKTVHFFMADYLFERVWSNLDTNSVYLQQAKAVLSPDFSLYTTMPLPVQKYNHYRKMFISKYWQNLYGIRVIPTACWSDESSYDFCFDGMPKNALIAVSSVGVLQNREAHLLFARGYQKMLETLEPAQILWYGLEDSCIDTSIPHIFVEPDWKRRFDNE